MRNSTVLLLILLFLAGSHSYAQFDNNPGWGGPPSNEKPAITAELVSSAKAVKPGSTFQIGVHFKLEPKWHIYGKDPGEIALPTEIKWVLPKGITLDGELVWPLDIQFETPMGPGEPPIKNRGYEKEVVLVQSFAVSSDAPVGELVVKAEVEWIGCKDQCMPGSKEFTLKLPVKATAETDQSAADLIATWLKKSQGSADLDGSKTDAPSTTGPSVIGGNAEMGFGLAVLFAIIGGLILNLMPCVLPILSIKIMGFIEQAGEKKHAWKHGLAFGGGVLISFWVLAGLLIGFRKGTAQLGWGFQLQHPLFVFCLVTLMFVMALNFFGVFEMGMSLTGIGQGKKRSGLGGSFFSGMLATVVATPCTAPFMGPAIGYALTLSAMKSMVIFSALGVGMATPYMLLSSFPGLLRYVPKPGRWMESLKQFMGFLLMGTVIYLLDVMSSQVSLISMTLVLTCLVVLGLAAWVYGRWSGLEHSRLVRNVARIAAALILLGGIALGKYAVSIPFDPANGSGSATADDVWAPYTPEALAAAQETDAPIFIDFTAKWCATCRTNKAIAFTDKVMAKFDEKGVALFRADWTNKDPAITKILQQYGRASVPVYLLYDRGKKEPIVLLEGLITPGKLLKALDKLESQK